MLSIALAFIPEDDTVKRTVLQIDSKVVPVSFTLDQQHFQVDSLSSQLEDVRNSLIAKIEVPQPQTLITKQIVPLSTIEVNAYSASYMEYEFNVKNTWAFWTKFVAPQLPTGSEVEVDEVQLARLLTSFTEKFEDNKVS